MPTALPVIKRALRLLKVRDPEETPTASEQATCVEAMNAMIARWQRDGIGIVYTPLEDSSGDFLVQDEAVEAVVYNLAVKVAPEFGKDASPTVMSVASSSYRDILRDSAGVAHADLESMPGDSRYSVSDLF